MSKIDYKDFNRNYCTGLLEQDDTVVRILGNSFEKRKTPYDHRAVMTSLIARDDNKAYLPVYFPVKKIKTAKGDKFVPDDSFILTRLYNKVNEAQWVLYTQEDLKERKGLRILDGGKIIDEKGYNGYYKKINTDAFVFSRVDKNLIDLGHAVISSDESIKPPKFYPHLTILMNVIDRKDKWCAENKKTRLLCSKKSSYFNKTTNDEEYNSSLGIGIQLYNKMTDMFNRYGGNWESIDTVFQKIYERMEKPKKFKEYAVCDGTEKKRFLNPNTENFISLNELTDEEKQYEQINLDELCKTSSYFLHKHFYELFAMCDKELKTNFVQELENLVLDEKNEFFKNNPRVEQNSQSNDEPPQYTPQEDIPQRRQAEKNTEGSTKSFSAEDIKKVFPLYDKLSFEDSVSLTEALQYISKGVPSWKSGTEIALCWKSDTCKFIGTDTKTSYPVKIAMCPVCGSTE